VKEWKNSGRGRKRGRRRRGKVRMIKSVNVNRVYSWILAGIT